MTFRRATRPLRFSPRTSVGTLRQRGPAFLREGRIVVTSTSGGARPDFRARLGGRLNLLRAWGRILQGYRPTLSLEITKECPLRCPGCYAYEPAHLGDAGPLRDLSDFRGDDLVARVLRLVRETRPVYISIVGGEDRKSGG